MHYHFDEIVDRSHTWSIKHDLKEANGKPADILPLWVADMDFRSPDGVREALKQAADHGIFGYSQADGSYFAAIRDWYKKRFGWEWQEEWMICTPGIVFAISAAVQAFTKEGDGILIQPPVYHPFSRAVIRNRRRLVTAPLTLSDGRYRMDLDRVEAAVRGGDVPLMILCNPHNPVGRVWTREELRDLEGICERYGVFVISDEIHGDFSWPGHPVTPYASLSGAAAAGSMTATAPSKTFNLAGLSTSNIFIADPDRRRRFQDVLLDIGQENMNRMGLIACRAAYEGGEEWLEELLSYLKGNLDLVRRFTEKGSVPIRLIEPDGTYLAWLDCRGMGMTDEELDEFFSQKARVWLDPGVHSGEEGSGFMRLNLGSPRSIIEEALGRIEAAWEEQNA